MDPVTVPAIGRDPDAFEAFYREHLPWVRSFVARRVGDPYAAADLTSDIFLAAIDSAAGYRPSAGAPAAWLAGVAHHVVAEHWRRQDREARANRRISGRALLDEDSIDLLTARLDGQRVARELYASLAGLPPGQRAVVELVALDGLSLADAARALGITAVAARVRYHRARARLQDTVSSPFEVLA